MIKSWEETNNRFHWRHTFFPWPPKREMKAVLHEKGGAFITLECRHRGATTDAIGTPLKLPLKLGGYGQMRDTWGVRIR